MTLAQGPVSQYRPAAGIVLFNKKGQVWLGKRSGKQTDYVWQFPQGGLDKGESPEFGALRELREETGISVDKLRPLARIEEELFYDFPPEYAGRGRMQKWRGQRQLWFAYRFIGKKSDVNLKFQKPAEFTKWRWGELHNAPELVVPFKRNVYERLVIEFEGFAATKK